MGMDLHREAELDRLAGRPTRLERDRADRQETDLDRRAGKFLDGLQKKRENEAEHKAEDENQAEHKAEDENQAEHKAEDENQAECREGAEPTAFVVAGHTFVNPEWLADRARDLENTGDLGGDVGNWENAIRMAEAMEALSSSLRTMVEEEVKAETVPGERLAGALYLFTHAKGSTRTYLDAARMTVDLPHGDFPDLYKEPAPDTREVRRFFPPESNPELYSSKTSEPSVKIEPLNKR